MATPITLVPAIAPAPSQGGASSQPAPGAGGFAGALQNLLETVDSTAGDANKAVAGMIQGTGDVHDAMIALQRAQSALELTIQIRNKVVQAYQDIMRMPV